MSGMRADLAMTVKRREAITFLMCVLVAVAGWAARTSASEVAALTPMEQKWLDAADPVLTFAVAQGLPIDVIVRPEATDEVPFSVGIADNRCKLILSMRHRTDAEAPLAGIPESQQAVLIEAMTAHEMAHCWRFMRGEWNSFPAEMYESLSFAGGDKIAQQRRAMREVQSEEAYADLVALAWTQWQHPDQYHEVHAWLVRVRNEQPAEGSFHDTRAWLELARDASVFIEAAMPFEQVQGLWVTGLKSTRARPCCR